MEHSNPTLAKIPILDTGKFKQLKFRIQQYLQHEHYALWEVIEFRDSYVAPQNNAATGSASEGTATKKGRTVAVTTEDMQKRRNDVKARTTLLLALPDEHQLRFIKYKTAQELWAAILKTFSRNEATKKTKKNLLKQHYGNFKAEGSETLEQTFNKLHFIVSQLDFMDIEIEQDDLNQKFLTSLAPEWLMHTIVWRNRSDLDTMSLDDLYNHLNVYETEVQKKSKSNSLNMAFISSFKNSSGNGEVNTASIPTANTQVSPTGPNVATASISLDTACAYIASQSNRSQIKYKDIHQIDEDDIEEMDIKWSALTTTRWATLLGSAGHPEAKKGVEEENHALVADEEAPIEFALMAKSSSDNEVFDNSLCSKACKKNTDSLNSKITDLSDKLCDSETMLYHYKLGLELDLSNKKFKIERLTNELEQAKKEKSDLDSKLTGFQSASKDLDNLLGSQRNDKNKEGLGYSAVPPPPAQVYSPLKKDMSWTGLPEPSPAIERNSGDLQNRIPSVTETGASSSTILSKPAINFVKSADRPTESKTDKVETAKKPAVKYAEMYRKTSKWSNDQWKTWAKNNYTHKSRSPRTVFYKTGRPPMRTNRPNMNVAQPKRTYFSKPAHSCVIMPFLRRSAVRTQSRVSRVPTVNQKFPTVNRKFPTVNRKFPTFNRKFSTADLGNKGKAVKALACRIWKPKHNSTNKGNSQNNIDDKGYWDSGCSKHMTSNISYLSDYEPFDGGYVSFGQGGCKITGKGTIKTGCIVLGRNFKLTNDTNVLLRTPKQYNMYSIDLNNVVPHKDLTCLVAKASVDECMLWHMRLGHLNIKTMNRLVRHNLVRGLPSKCFDNDHTCVACLKGKQHKASCKTKLMNLVTKPLHTLHMDLFDPTSVSSLNHKWCDNGGEFRNKEMNDFYSRKGIKKEFSNARTPQQNGVAERRNRTLIEAARTMLADAKLPVTFWAEAVNTAWKFEEKGDEGYFIGYSMSSKAFRVFNKRTKRVEENLHVDFLENKLIEKRAGPNWLFDIDTLTNSMNYVPVVSAGTTSTNFSGTNEAARQDVKKDESSLRYIALPNWFHEAHLESSTSNAQDACNADAPESSGNSNPTATSTNPPADHMETLAVETPIPIVSSPVSTTCLNDSSELSSDTRLISKRDTSQDDTPSLDNILTLTNRFEDILGVTTNSDDSNGVQADLGNMEYNISASPTPTFRIHKDHPKSQIICHVDTLVQTRTKGKAIGTKWVLNNKKDERGTAIRNKARLVAQGHTQEERIDYDEVFAPIARIKAIRLFLAYASFMGFTVYQMDVKSAFLYGTIDEEVYVMQPHGFQDPEFPARVYKVEKAMYGLHLAPRAWYGTLSKYLLTNGFQRGTIDQALFIRRQRGDFILVQVYVDDIIFGSSNPQLCREFEALMQEKFQMSAMDSDYGGSTQDRKSTTGGCQFLGRRLISWQCKKQTIVATSTTEAEYVAAANSCGQVLWIQNQLLDYGYNFMNTKIYIDSGFCRGLPSEVCFDYQSLVYVSHIRQFWSTARIETTDEGTKILATVDGKPRTISESSIRRNFKLKDEAGISSLPDAELFENLTLMRYNILPNQKFSFQKDEPASPLGDDSQGEACPTDSGFEAEQHKENARIKHLEDRDGGDDDPSGEDATIKRRSLETWEEACIERSTEKGSDDTEEMVNVLTSLDAASVLSSGVQVSVSPAAEVATVSVPMLLLVKGKEKMVESETPKKKKLQEQMDVQMARQLEEEMERDAQRMNEQITRDAEIARIHAEEELQMMIDGLDRSNEMIAKHLQEYEQAAAELTIREKIELINELVNYQDHLASILKYKAQQSKPLSKKQQREFYMSVLRGHAGWKTKHFKGMSLEEIREKFVPVWKQIEDFVPIGKTSDNRLQTEGQRSYWKIMRLGESTASYQFFVDMLKRFDREDLSQLWALVKETLNIRQATSDKEKELWVELKRLYEPDVEDQLWTQTQALMHDPVEWRLYDSCGVHHVLSRDQEIFMMVEKEYPLRKGLAIAMIINKLQVENYSQMANDLIQKIYKIANSPSQRID
nr:hypothetical protein [Tanacetum cinerariifolium]